MEHLLSIHSFAKAANKGDKTIKAGIEDRTIPHFKSVKRVYIPASIKEALELKEAKSIIAPECIVISTGNHKGGVLKTTNSLNLGSSLAFYGYNVLLLDQDPQSNATKAFGLYHDKHDLKRNNIIQLMLDLEEGFDDDEYIEKIKSSIINIEHESIFGKLDILPNDPLMIDKVKYLDEIANAENSLDYILSFVKNDYDFIIIDTPPRTDTILKVCLMASDYFTISLKPEPFSGLGVPDIFKPIKRIKRAYRALKNKDLFVLGGIIGDFGASNLHRDSTLQNKKDIELLTNNTASIFENKISHFQKVGESQLGDGAMLFTNYQHQATHEYFLLANEIVKKILEVEVAVRNTSKNESKEV